jgi:hypothetical protein
MHHPSALRRALVFLALFCLPLFSDLRIGNGLVGIFTSLQTEMETEAPGSKGKEEVSSEAVRLRSPQAKRFERRAFGLVASAPRKSFRPGRVPAPLSPHHSLVLPLRC